MEKTITITVFAKLKDFLPHTTELSGTYDEVEDVLGYLKEKFPLAKDILASSRMASESRILDPTEKIDAHGHYYIFPPSSGG